MYCRWSFPGSPVGRMLTCPFRFRYPVLVVLPASDAERF